MQHANPYARLALMAIISFAAMYALMYAMVDVLTNAIPNINQFYMAGLMAAAMVPIELMTMSAMYPNKKLNIAIAAASILILALFAFGIREQAAIADEQFLKSMIPHHAGAILMCGKARLADPDIRELCQNILSGQQAEIDWMKAKLEEMR